MYCWISRKTRIKNCQQYFCWWKCVSDISKVKSIDRPTDTPSDIECLSSLFVNNIFFREFIFQCFFICVGGVLLLLWFELRLRWKTHIAGLIQISVKFLLRHIEMVHWYLFLPWFVLLKPYETNCYFIWSSTHFCFFLFG